jgi:hypothetical protein
MRPPTIGTGPSIAPQLADRGGRYLGRIIIEAWEPSATTGDGLTLMVALADGSPSRAGIDQFLREVVERLQVRLQRQRSLR